MRVSTIATGEKSTSARRLASLSCKSRVRSLIFVSSASRSTRRAFSLSCQAAVSSTWATKSANELASSSSCSFQRRGFPVCS